jgi:hypothetical protein
VAFALAYAARRAKNMNTKATSNNPQFQKVPGARKIMAIDTTIQARPITEKIMRSRRF